MKITLINGSPRGKRSASECILEELKTFLGNENQILEYNFCKKIIAEEALSQLSESDALVFAFPLYVDGVPSHLLYCLKQLELYLKVNNTKEIKVYVIVNCGFFEGKQNVLAIRIMEHWCKKAGLTWGQGLAIGAGGMLASVRNIPSGYGPKKNLGVAFQTLSDSIIHLKSKETCVVNMNFPRIAYKLAAEAGWRKKVKVNGLKKKDLYRKA